jgi:hypothetical protein
MASAQAARQSSGRGFSYETEEGARGFAAARAQNCQLVRTSGGDSQPFRARQMSKGGLTSTVSRKSDTELPGHGTIAEPLSSSL